MTSTRHKLQLRVWLRLTSTTCPANECLLVIAEVVLEARDGSVNNFNSFEASVLEHSQICFSCILRQAQRILAC